MSQDLHARQTSGPRAPADHGQARASVTRGALAFGAFVSVAMVVIVALLSDRAPRFARQLKRFILQVGVAFEEAFGVDWLDRDSFPGTFDQIGHAMLWATAMFVLGMTFRRWVPPFAMAVFVLGSSALLEVLQGVLTTSRRVELFDFVANGVGILFALVVVLIVGFMVDVVMRFTKNSGRDSKGARLP